MKKLYYSVFLFGVYGLLWVIDDLPHEILGVLIGMLLLGHLMVNARWFGNLWKGSYGGRRKWMTIVNGLFFLAMVATLVTGLMYSRDLFPYLAFHQSAKAFKKIHEACAMVSAGCLLLHTYFHKELVFTYITKLRERFRRS